MTNRYLPLIAWIATLLVALIVLTAVGAGLPEVPSTPSTWGPWFVAHDPVVSVFVLLRLLAAAAIVYLLCATAGALIVPSAAVARRFAPAVVQRVTRQALGLTLVGSLALAAPATAAPSDAPVLHHVDRSPSRAAPSTSVSPATVPEKPRQADTYTVQRGDSFWSIAEAHGTTDVVAYWRQLIEANRHQLPVPSNPDLLYSGQVLTLP